MTIQKDETKPILMENGATNPLQAGNQLGLSTLRKVIGLVMLAGATVLGASAIRSAVNIVGRITTTGCEEEPLFSIWTVCQGRTPYMDSSDMPFAASCYNWLFYQVYGPICKWTLLLWNLDESALPIIARFVTLSFTVSCIGILYGILNFLKPQWLNFGRVSWLAFSIVLVLNPLTETWIISARPDMAALACELAALFWGLKYLKTLKPWHLYAAIVMCYGAWAFKHSSINVLAGLSIFFIVRRRWKELGLVLGSSSALWCVTLLAGGALFRYALFKSQINCQFGWPICMEGIRSAIDVAPQLVPLAIGLAFVGILSLWQRGRSTADASLLLMFISMCALAIAIAGLCKQGSYINYLFPFSILGLIWVIVAVEAHLVDRVSRWIIQGACLTTLLVFSGVLLNELPSSANRLCAAMNRMIVNWKMEEPRLDRASTSGPGNTHGQVDPVQQLKEHLKSLSPPVLITDRAYNLPWVQGKDPHFVFAYAYMLDRKAGRDFWAGGIGGLVESGLFNTIVVSERISKKGLILSPVKTADGLTIDGGSMSKYEWLLDDGMFSYYVKRKLQTP